MRDDAPVLHVDPIACDGHGLCAELFPERTVSPAREVHHLVVPGDAPRRRRRVPLGSRSRFPAGRPWPPGSP